MRHRVLSLVTFACLMPFILSGCHINTATPIDLLSKPKLNSDQQFVIELIMSAIPHDAYIARPMKSNNLNSVGFVDVDGDNVNEIYAFYVDKNSKNVGLVLIYQDQDGWKLLTDIRLIGSDIAYSEFVDCDGDDVKEFVIGTISEEQNHKNLFIARYENTKFDVIYRDFYTEIIIDDFDENGISDIAMFKLDRNNFAYAEIIEFEEEQLKIIAKAELDPYISGYYNIVFERIDKNRKGFVLDFETGSKSATNLLFFEKGKLVKAFDSFEHDDEYKKTLKLSPIKSYDIDGDGLIEIANNFKINTSSGEPKVSSGLVIWNNFVNRAFEIKKVFFLGDANRLKIEIPDQYIESVLNNHLELVEHSGNDRTYQLDFYMDFGDMYSPFISLKKMSIAEFKGYVENREKEISGQSDQALLEFSESDGEGGARTFQKNTDSPVQLGENNADESAEDELLTQKFEAFRSQYKKIRGYYKNAGILELEIPNMRGNVFFIEFYDLNDKGVFYHAEEVLSAVILGRFEDFHDRLPILLEQFGELIQQIELI